MLHTPFYTNWRGEIGAFFLFFLFFFKNCLFLELKQINKGSADDTSGNFGKIFAL